MYYDLGVLDPGHRRLGAAMLMYYDLGVLDPGHRRLGAAI